MKEKELFTLLYLVVSILLIAFGFSMALNATHSLYRIADAVEKIAAKP